MALWSYIKYFTKQQTLSVFLKHASTADSNLTRRDGGLMFLSAFATNHEACLDEAQLLNGSLINGLMDQPTNQPAARGRV